MDAIERAARRIVELVVLQTGGSFDYAEHGKAIQEEIELAANHYLYDEGIITSYWQDGKRQALQEARAAITFEALNPDPWKAWKWPTEGLNRRFVGYCVSRAKSLLREMERRA